MSSRLRVGIVGLGFGARVHAPTLLSFPDVDLVGLAARSKLKAQRVAESLGIPTGCGSVAELLALNLDAIFFALPPDEVYTSVNEALLLRLPIYCEKPLCDRQEKAIELAEKAIGLTTAMGFIFAELDVFIHLKKIIQERCLGNVRHANVLWLTESVAQRSQNWSWKLDANRYGGVLTLLGSHVLYLAEWLFGPLERGLADLSVSNQTEIIRRAGATKAEDLVCGCLRTPDATISFTIGNANPGSRIHRWTIVFEDGTVVLENTGLDFTSFSLCIFRPDKPPEFKHEEQVDMDGRTKLFARIARRFLDSARAGRPMTPSFHSGARVASLDNALRLSNWLRKEVSFEKQL